MENKTKYPKKPNPDKVASFNPKSTSYCSTVVRLRDLFALKCTLSLHHYCLHLWYEIDSISLSLFQSFVAILT
ncbi:hypothetical protein QVD17_35867 [Tagetes erecta]|uniref:Uncharacterized protein n=1 Tax=Tagetes erecta TaxID=13708 RepID=A0AAD8JTG3_TARER|nr:hypothetical protein QVD17_35867 [Tagetes erecta]